MANKKRAVDPQIETKINHVLEEARVLLPGTQVLLAFQLTAVFQQSFSKLSLYLQYFHLVSLCLLSLAIIMLFGIVSFHRIAEKGTDTERFHSFANNILLISLLLLGLGLCIDIFVIFSFITKNIYLSGIIALVSGFFAIWFWFVYTHSQRGKMEFKMHKL